MRSGWHRFPSINTDKLVNGFVDVATMITRIGLGSGHGPSSSVNSIRSHGSFLFIWSPLIFLPFVSVICFCELSCTSKAHCWLILLSSVFFSLLTCPLVRPYSCAIYSLSSSILLPSFLPSFLLTHSLTLSLSHSLLPGVSTIFVFRIYLTLFLLPG